MFRFCPACASENIRFELDKVFRCPDCGLTYYHNVAAATACFVRTREGILFIVRAKEPGKGKLDLPGGFVDPGEGAMEGLRREFIEELGWDPQAKPDDQAKSTAQVLQGDSGAFTLFASFPNKYPYKNIPYNTCDLFFYLNAPDLTKNDIRFQTSEIAGVEFIKPKTLDMEKIAFESVKKAIRVYLDKFGDA